MKPVPNWRDSWKWFSTWLIAVAATAPMLYAELPKFQALLEPTQYLKLQAAFTLLIFVGRIVSQTPAPRVKKRA